MSQISNTTNTYSPSLSTNWPPFTLARQRYTRALALCIHSMMSVFSFYVVCHGSDSAGFCKGEMIMKVLGYLSNLNPFRDRRKCVCPD